MRFSFFYIALCVFGVVRASFACDRLCVENYTARGERGHSHDEVARARSLPNQQPTTLTFAILAFFVPFGFFMRFVRFLAFFGRAHVTRVGAENNTSRDERGYSHDKVVGARSLLGQKTTTLSCVLVFCWVRAGIGCDLGATTSHQGTKTVTDLSSYMPPGSISKRPRGFLCTPERPTVNGEVILSRNALHAFGIDSLPFLRKSELFGSRRYGRGGAPSYRVSRRHR